MFERQQQDSESEAEETPEAQAAARQRRQVASSSRVQSSYTPSPDVSPSLEEAWTQSYLRQRRPIERPEEEFQDHQAAVPSVSSTARVAPEVRAERPFVPPSWHLAGALLIGAVSWLHRTVPDEESFQAFVQPRYGHEATQAKKKSRYLLSDRSFSSHPSDVAWQNVANLIALGSTTINHRGFQYEHHYLGLGGFWIPLPYLPRVHLKSSGRGFRWGLGLCYNAHCFCIPDKKAPCQQLVWDTSTLLSLVLGLNILLFVIAWFTEPGRSHRRLSTSRLCTISLPNLYDCNVIALLLAPFCHRGLFEFGRNMTLLVNVLEASARHGNFLFLALYIGGSISHFFGCCLALKLFGPEWLLPYEVSHGCRGGLSSILSLLAKVSPDERFRYSLYFIEVPRPLSPLSTLAANAVVDAAFAQGKGRLMAELAGHAASFAFGTIVAYLFL